MESYRSRPKKEGGAFIKICFMIIVKYRYVLYPVLRIHDILGWIRIRIRGSMSLTDPAIFVMDLQDASKKLIFYTIFSAYYFLRLHLHHFSKIKSQKESQNSRNQGFSYYFCMMIEGSGSIPLASGSGSGSWRPKNMWIRIRISNTDCTISYWPRKLNKSLLTHAYWYLGHRY
jgi:hypothetical protein